MESNLLVVSSVDQKPRPIHFPGKLVSFDPVQIDLFVAVLLSAQDTF